MACSHVLVRISVAELPQLQKYRAVDWCELCGTVIELLIEAGKERTTELSPKIVKVVKRWVKSRKVSCPESLQQVDAINEDLPELAAKICRVVGYHKEE